MKSSNSCSGDNCQAGLGRPLYISSMTCIVILLAILAVILFVFCVNANCMGFVTKVDVSIDGVKSKAIDDNVHAFLPSIKILESTFRYLSLILFSPVPITVKISRNY